MFRLLNTLYSDWWMSYTLYDIIKTAIVNVDTRHDKNMTDANHDQYNNIFPYVNTRGLPAASEVADVKEEYVLIEVEHKHGIEHKDDEDVANFTAKNHAFQLNFLRSDMISWKKSKLKYTYVEEAEWEYINDPSNLPCNNYLLYLLENMPENIICHTTNLNWTANNKKKDGWKRVDEIGLEKEACAILNTLELDEATRDNIWVDDRILGEKWRGLFSSISPHDTYIEMAAPVML